VRLACTLRQPAGLAQLSEVEQSLYLRPKNRLADPASTYAYSLYPDRLTTDSKSDFTFSLGPVLKFGEAELKGVRVNNILNRLKINAKTPRC
jgi:hypothetical protein